MKGLVSETFDNVTKTAAPIDHKKNVDARLRSGLHEDTNG